MAIGYCFGNVIKMIVIIVKRPLHVLETTNHPACIAFLASLYLYFVKEHFLKSSCKIYNSMSGHKAFLNLIACFINTCMNNVYHLEQPKFVLENQLTC